MYRESLGNGSRIIINEKEYVIDHLIGRGGTSLVYQATEEGNNLHPWIVKEFFPQNYIAYRRRVDCDGPNGKIVAYSWQEQIWDAIRNKFFDSEPVLGNKFGDGSFQAYAFDNVDVQNGYAVMRPFPEDTISLLELMKRWEQVAPLSPDLEFADMGRVLYALRITEALLLVLDCLHKSQLHLDISLNNVAWGGLDINQDGKHCNIFLIDFGCASELKNRIHIKENPFFYSYSRGFSAPEIKNSEIEILDSKADLYSAAVLFFCLCLGKKAMLDTHWEMKDDLWKRTRWLQDCLKQLKIPNEFREKICHIILGCCKKNPKDREYISASEMLDVIERLHKEMEEYKHPHIYLSEVKPISTTYVRHSEDLLRQIEDALNKENICFIHGMSGVGKSELMRQYAEEKLKHLPVLEIYFPERQIEYSMDYVVPLLTYVNLKDKKSLEEKKEVLNSFLEKEVFLLIHNFNNPDISFLEKKFKRDNVKIIVSTQCTKKQLEVNNVSSMSLIELTPDINLGIQIFNKVYEQHRMALPGDLEQRIELSQKLFNIPLLINLVATQLVKQNKIRFHWLLNRLREKRLNEVFNKPMSYRKEFIECPNGESKNETLYGTPFEILYQLIHSILPDLTIRQEQCLQVVSRIPGVWIDSEDLELIIGDLDLASNFEMIETEDFEFASEAITKLIDLRLLHERHENGKRQINMHALMAAIVISEINGKSYIDEPSLEFWQHLEKNFYVWQMMNGVSYKEAQASIRSSEIFSYVKSWYLERNEYKTELNRCGSFGESLLKEAKENYKLPVFLGLVRLISGNFNQPINIELPVKNSKLFFEEVVIYYNYGIVILKQCDEDECSDLKSFCIVMNAKEQLKNTYYMLPKKNTEEKEGKFCSIKVHHKVYTDNTEIILPDEFCGTPIYQIEYYDNTIGNIEDIPKPYNLRTGVNCKTIKGDAFHARSVELNDGIKTIDLECHNLVEWNLPATVEEITDRCLHEGIKKVNLLPNNRTFIEKSGIIYTRDQKKLLFAPKHKRNIELVISKDFSEINTYCFQIDKICMNAPEYSISRMSYYELEKLVAKERFSDTEKNILEYINDLSLDNVLENARVILHNFQEKTKDMEVPFYLKYFMTSSVWENERWIDILISCWKEENSDSKIQIPGKDFFLKIEERKLKYMKQKLKDELFQKISVYDFKRIYDLLLEEGIRRSIMFGNIRLYTDVYFEVCYYELIKVYLLPYEQFICGINLLKNKYGCDTLSEISEKREISNQTLLNELVRICYTELREI